MLTNFPNLFDRNFAVGFALPAAVLAGAIWVVLAAHGVTAWPNRESFEEIGSALIAVLTVWIVAITMLALNYQLLRLLEGYPLARMLRLYRRAYPAGAEWIEARLRRRFERYAAALALQAEIDAARREQSPSPTMPGDHATELRYGAEFLPAATEQVLPTRLGNLFRAFEVYSNVLYNLDAIPAWPRLEAVMPEHARQLLADAKAQVDFAVNMWAAGALGTFVYAALAVWRLALPEPWLVVIGLAMCVVAYQLALQAAAQFGGHVKSAFDLYRGDLATALGLSLPRSIEAEREMWRSASRMMIYRSSVRAEELVRFRRHRDE